MTDRSHRIDFDELMRSLTVIGFVALTAWRWNKLTPDERSGFTNPLAATGSQQPRA